MHFVPLLKKKEVSNSGRWQSRPTACTAVLGLTARLTINQASQSEAQKRLSVNKKTAMTFEALHQTERRKG